jgi:hypothetical protein
MGAMGRFMFLLFIAIGIYAIAGAALDAEWFLGDHKAQVFVRLLGRAGTRIFYMLLGMGLILLGIFGVFGFLG